MTARPFLLAVFVVLAAFLPMAPGLAQVPPPIVDADIRSISQFDLSPDGHRLVWLASRNGKPAIYVRELFAEHHRVIAEAPGLAYPHWDGTNRHIYAMADRNGDEHHHVLIFDPETPMAPGRDLTPFPGKKAFMIDVNNPDGSALVGINLDNPESPDLFRVSPSLAKPQLVLRQAKSQIRWMTTLGGEVFGRVILTPERHMRIETRRPGQTQWQGFTLSSPFVSSGDALLAHSDPQPDGSAWLVMRGEGDISTAQRIDLATGRVLDSVAAGQADAEHVLFERDSRPLLLQSMPGAPQLRVFDPGLRALLQTLPLPIHSHIKASSFNLAMTRLLLLFSSDSGSEHLVYVDREAKLARILFQSIPPVFEQQTPRTTAVSLRARDGLTLNGYVTLPPGSAGNRLPMVLLVHGGPWLRDRWEFEGMAVALAMRGNAVLRVNYRGSSGYGRAFEAAGHGEWGAKMQDDLTDATCWAVAQGLADPSRMVIMGGSYGGYAALMGLVRTPRLYAAGVEENGITDLPAHLAELPPYARMFLPQFTAFIGKDQAQQWERSPLAHVEDMERPLLAFHGTNDSRVNVTQLRKLENAMRAGGKEITAIYFEDEGHGVANSGNAQAYFEKVTNFVKVATTGRSGIAPDLSYCQGPYAGAAASQGKP